MEALDLIEYGCGGEGLQAYYLRAQEEAKRQLLTPKEPRSRVRNGQSLVVPSTQWVYMAPREPEYCI